jgi:hypothetical protein
VCVGRTSHRRTVNIIGDDGVAAIAGALKTNSAITELDISGAACMPACLSVHIRGCASIVSRVHQVLGSATRVRPRSLWRLLRTVHSST